MHDASTLTPPPLMYSKASTKRAQVTETSIPVIVHPAPDASWNTAPTVKVEDMTDPEYVPKSKKGRKSSTITCDIPVMKQTANAPPPLRPCSPPAILPDSSDPQSQTIISKITAALQQHSFKLTDGSLQPAALAKMVSSIISNVNVEVTSANKEIATSLVNAMAVAAPDVEKAPTDKTEDDKPTKRMGRPKKIRRGRSPKVREEAVSPRAKRQAAITAELKMETSQQSPSVINLDDDSDAEYFPDDDYVHNDSDHEPAAKTPSKAVPQKPKPQPTTSKAEEDSILLSDEETPSAPAQQSEVSIKTEDVIPLHTSLLSNNNFIKIVAHTYLKGNPMMDEDAATLAAEYSTSKALKEVESTGRSIESGPIYDIAKKVRPFLAFLQFVLCQWLSPYSQGPT